MGKRLLLSLSALLAFSLCATGCCKNSGVAENQSSAPENAFTLHCQFLRVGEIEVVIGDGAGFRTRPGVWSLASIHRHFNIFKTMGSGLLCGEFRGRSSTVLEYVDDTTCVLKVASDENRAVAARAVYRAVSPYYIDHELTFSDTKNRLAGKPYDFRSVGYCCYTNSPDDLRIHYLSGGEWVRYAPPEHGAPHSAIAPGYVPEEQLEVWPELDDPPFWWKERYPKPFDEPFYYGRFDDMVMILVFDQPDRIRFFLSPEGGGRSLIPGSTSTAWDFEWIIPGEEYEAGREYTFRLRLVYKKYEGDEDVLREVRKAQDELGFERVGNL